MDSEKARQLDYISKVFSTLSTEKQDNVLKAARSLLVLQRQVPVKNEMNKKVSIKEFEK
jgi:hypothetical protein